MRGFSHIQRRFPALGIDPSPSAAKAYLKGTCRQFIEIYDRSIERWMLRPQEKQVSDEILGRGRNPRNQLASNLALRLLVGSHLIDFFEAMRLANPCRRFFMVTLISDRWLSFDRRTTIWLGGMKPTIRRVMDRGNFDGWFCTVEVQTLDETIAGLGRILLPHAHAIAWSDDPSFDLEAAETQMCKSDRLVCRSGAKTAVLSHAEDSSPTNLAAYMLKAPSVAKYRVINPSSPSGFSLADTKLPPVSAVRQTEVLSSFYLDELMLTGGDGGPLLTNVKRLMRDASCSAGLAEIGTQRAGTFWPKLRVRTGNQKYRPVRVDRSREQLHPLHPVCVAGASFVHGHMRGSELAWRLELTARIDALLAVRRSHIFQDDSVQRIDGESRLRPVENQLTRQAI